MNNQFIQTRIMALLTGSFYIDLCAILVSVIAIAVIYFRRSYNYWEQKGVTNPPASFPFGNAAEVALQKETLGVSMRKVYQDLKNKGLGYSGYYMMTKPIILVFDLELVKAILAKDFFHFSDHGNYINEKNDPLGANLFGLKGAKWKNLRAKLSPTFTSGKMKMMFQTLVDCSDELIVLMNQKVENNEAIDIKDVVARYTTDVIGSCAFGIECNSLKYPDSDFRKYGKMMFHIDTIQMIKGILSMCAPGVMDFFQIPVTNTEITKFFMNIVKETVDYREKNNIIRRDFMHLLIQLKNNIKIEDGDQIGELKSSDNEDNVGKTLTIEEIAAQSFIFFLGGFETSSTTLTFCLFELASNFDIQNKLRQEISEVLEKHSQKVTYDAIMGMTYMDKVINETLRKYPALPLLQRECTKPYILPGSDVLLDKGTIIFIPIMGIQYDPEYYPDPERFDPERFSAENKAGRHQYSWLPFGEGPRMCIGLRFGLLQTKVALTILLKNYKFRINSKTQLPLTLDTRSFILSAQGGIWLNAEKV